MAVTRRAGGGHAEYFGLAEDEKPTENVPPGSSFIETDTAQSYRWSGTEWFEFSTAEGGSSGAITAGDGDIAGIGAVDEAAWDGVSDATLIALGKALWTKIKVGSALRADSLAVAVSTEQLGTKAATAAVCVTPPTEGFQVLTPALRGTPISGAMETPITTTTRTIVPWVSGREPDEGEAGYISKLSIVYAGDAGGQLTLHDGDSPSIIDVLPLANAIVSYQDALYITPGNNLYITASVAPTALRVGVQGFEGLPAPA